MQKDVRLFCYGGICIVWRDVSITLLIFILNNKVFMAPLAQMNKMTNAAEQFMSRKFWNKFEN